MPKNTVSKTSKKLFSTSTLVTLSLLTALSIILERFLGFMPTPNIRIAFGNLPIILAGLLFGPVAGGIVALLSDILGTTLFSSFPWFAPMALTPVIMGVVPRLSAGLCETQDCHFIAPFFPRNTRSHCLEQRSLQMLTSAWR